MVILKSESSLMPRPSGVVSLFLRSVTARQHTAIALLYCMRMSANRI